MNDRDGQFSLRRLFLGVAFVAFAVGLISFAGKWPFAGLVGLGLLLFHVSQTVDALSRHIRNGIVSGVVTALATFAIGFSAPCVLLGVVLHCLQIFGKLP